MKRKNRKLPSHEGYIQFLLRQPCANPDCKSGKIMVAHHEHLKQGGIALKSHDTHRLPLCLECHVIRHMKGVKTFWGNVDLAMMCLDYITAYFIELAEGVEYEEKEFVELVSLGDNSDPGARSDLAAGGSG